MYIFSLLSDDEQEIVRILWLEEVGEASLSVFLIALGEALIQVGKVFVFRGEILDPYSGDALDTVCSLPCFVDKVYRFNDWQNLEKTYVQLLGMVKNVVCSSSEHPETVVQIPARQTFGEIVSEFQLKGKKASK